ncbi:cytochrome c3 family protein [Candidatus Nitrospira bockiana]
MKPRFGLVLLGAAVALAAGLATLYSQGSADLAAQDRQPIAFSHELHAGELKIACLYCHRHAEISQVAGIPSLRLCMTCHASMPTGSEDARMLAAHWEQRRPIEWVRLQRLPDFVYFTHEMHVNAGLQCAACHGDVERMPHTPRASTYEMGWCVTCHQQQHASLDCWTCHK